jgi:hypothetical protein
MRSVGGIGRLFPKSTGGRVALGVGAMGVAAAVVNQRRRSNQRMEAAMHGVAVGRTVRGMRSGELPVPQGYDTLQVPLAGQSYNI